MTSTNRKARLATACVLLRVAIVSSSVLPFDVDAFINETAGRHEITNRSTRPVALVHCMPWCGRLWSEGGQIALGHSLKWEE